MLLFCTALFNHKNVMHLLIICSLHSKSVYVNEIQCNLIDPVNTYICVYMHYIDNLNSSSLMLIAFTETYISLDDTDIFSLFLGIGFTLCLPPPPAFMGQDEL